MTYRGTVEKGLVRLADNVRLPEGTEVSVRPLRRGRKRPAEAQHAGRTLASRRLLKLAGQARGLPRDASVNLDHYLYDAERQG